MDFVRLGGRYPISVPLQFTNFGASRSLSAWFKSRGQSCFWLPTASSTVLQDLHHFLCSRSTCCCNNLHGCPWNLGIRYHCVGCRTFEGKFGSDWTQITWRSWWMSTETWPVRLMRRPKRFKIFIDVHEGDESEVVDVICENSFCINRVLSSFENFDGPAPLDIDTEPPSFSTIKILPPRRTHFGALPKEVSKDLYHWRLAIYLAWRANSWRSASGSLP